MGYIYSATGEIGIQPPLPFKVFRESDFADPRAKLLHFEIENRTSETDEGIMLIKSAYEIAPLDDGVKIHDLDEQLNAIFALIPAEVELTGWIEYQGEDAMSWFRIYPKLVDVANQPGGRMWTWRKVYAVLEWPLIAHGYPDNERIELSRG